MPTLCSWSGRAASGRRGPQGNVPEAAATGEPGNAGTILEKENTPQRHLQYLDLTVLRMVLHEAELDYLNDRRVEAARKLFWVLELCESPESLGTEAFVSEATLSVEAVERDHLDAICYRARVLLVQLEQGVNVYGYYPGHVPLTSVEVYKAVIQQLLDLATHIEAAYETYHDEQQSTTEQRRALAQAVDLLELKRPELKRQTDQIAFEVDETRDQISDLLIEEETLRLKLAEAREAFRRAVSREAACDVGEVLVAAGAIVAIATGVGAVAAGVGGLMEMNELIQKKKLKDSLKAKGEYIVKELRVVKGGLDKIRQGYSDIKEVLQRERDGAKLIAREEEFEETIKRFEHLEEAREYRRLMRQYLEVIKVRNTKILHVDSLVTRLLELDSEDEQLVLEIERTRGRMVEIFNPRLAEHVVFFERAVARIRADILRAIVMEYRALEYWALRRPVLPANLQDRSVDHLKVYHSNFLTSHLREMETRNQAPQEFQGPVEIVFNREDNPEELELLDSEGRLTFRISPDHPAFRYYAQTLVSEVTVTLYGAEGARFEGIRWVFLRHHGDPTFVDRQGEAHVFSHRARLQNGPIEGINNGVSLSLGGLQKRFAFLSPLATWTLMVENGNEGGRETADIQKIGFLFSGRAFARYGVEESSSSRHNSNARAFSASHRLRSA